MKVKDIDPLKVDSAMSAVSSVIKAIIKVAQCIDSFRSDKELKDASVV